MTLLDLCDAPAPSLTSQLAAYLKSRPLVWVDGRELATVAGAYAWRSRCADCRKQFGMTIENKQERHAQDGRKWTVSLYRYVPDAAASRGLQTS